MTLAELVAATYLKATGKVSSLTSADTKYLKILGIANELIRQWANQRDVDWSSLYNPTYSIGTVTATKTFALGSTVRKISDTRGDFVEIVGLDGNTYDYAIVSADTLKRYEDTAKVCAQIGSNLVFKSAFTSSSAEFGGTINVPIYTFPAALADSTDVVPVDIPEWLVIMAAAEYVRNDVTKQNQYSNLVQEANEIMLRMIDDNDAQVEQVYTPFLPLGKSW